MTGNELRAALFGERVNLSRLSRITGINRKTLKAYYTDPDTIPIGRARQIGRVIGTRIEVMT